LAFPSGREADHSPPSSAEAKEWSKKTVSNESFILFALHGAIVPTTPALVTVAMFVLLVVASHKVGWPPVASMFMPSLMKIRPFFRKLLRREQGTYTDGLTHSDAISSLIK
jgi:hypothetical protein